MATVTEERKLIPRIKTYVICRTHHQDEESIRYMIGIVRSTLAESLKHQTDKDFTFVWLFNEGCKFERYREKMLKAAGIDFQFFMPIESALRTEIECDPACFLSSGLISKCKVMEREFFLGCYYRGSHAKGNVIFSSGFVHHDGKTVACDKKADCVSCSFHVRSGEELQMQTSYSVIDEPSWILVRHSLSIDPMNSGVLRKPARAAWDGWNPALVDRYVMTRMTTGTSKGSTLEPYKSKSLIRVRRPGKVPRGRRRRDDVAE